MLYESAKAVATRFNDGLKLYDRYRIVDHDPDAKTLILMLAGYKPDLWPTVMPRFAAAIPEGATVCLVSPGIWSDEVAAIARRNGWSYLSTKTNDVALAQNVCLKIHTAAEMVVKLDEDMYLVPGSIRHLIDYYRQIKAEGLVHPGFVAPTIPVNGFSYRVLLQRLDLLDAFEQKFGVARIATTGTPISDDPAAARWIWERTAPLEQTAARLQDDVVPLQISPIKFSIGLIVFERKFWQEIRHYPVYRRRLMAKKNTLGADEEFLCKECMDRSRPIVIHPRVIAGHFSFGRQYEGMRSLLDERPDLFIAS